MVSKQKEFIDRLANLTDYYFRLSDRFESFELYKRVNIPHIRIKINNFKNRFLNFAREVEELNKCKSMPEFNDAYFIHMRLIDLARLERKLDEFEDEFEELEKWVDEEKRRVIEDKAKASFSITGSGRSDTSGILYEVHDDDYEALMRKFVRENLTFYCPHCHAKVQFGDERCENCDRKIDWFYDMDETLARLMKNPNKMYKCPNPNCGAPIRLDWPNCAYCGLDIQKMLKTMIFF